MAEKKGGFSIARSAEDGGGNNSVINRIMQRFRPIAPKPAAASGGGEASNNKIVAQITRNGRVKRKYQLRVRRQRRNKTKNISSSPPESGIQRDGSSSTDQVVTLQLLPERSDDDYDDGAKDSLKSVPRCSTNSGSNINNNNNNNNNHEDHQLLPTLIKCSTELMTDEKLYDFSRSGIISRVVETWIIVERVTEICMEGVELLGLSDTDRMNYLQMDISPGFVSDASNNVVWVNDAYKKTMVSHHEDDEDQHHKGSPLMELKVWLVMKESLPFRSPAFACRITHHYMRPTGHKCSRTVPCDVWRMDFGGFAWKLDTTAALGLGI